MYSKFFRHSNVDALEEQLDMFLKELDEVTGQIVNLEILKQNDEIIVLVIYSCWKKL
jgi:hypothetical protein